MPLRDAMPPFYVPPSPGLVSDECPKYECSHPWVTHTLYREIRGSFYKNNEELRNVSFTYTAWLKSGDAMGMMSVDMFAKNSCTPDQKSISPPPLSRRFGGAHCCHTSGFCYTPRRLELYLHLNEGFRGLIVST